jgi:hypothetical protein
MLDALINRDKNVKSFLFGSRDEFSIIHGGPSKLLGMSDFVLVYKLAKSSSDAIVKKNPH